MLKNSLVYTHLTKLWCFSSIKKGYLGYQTKAVCLMSMYTPEIATVTKVRIYKSLQLCRNEYIVEFCISVLL